MASKLKLNLDMLSIETFDTSAEKEKEGTVFGEECTCVTNCTCPGCPTCYNTCPETCGAATAAATCGNTCGQSCYGSCDYTCDGCNTYNPCTTALYTACGNLHCY